MSPSPSSRDALRAESRSCSNWPRASARSPNSEYTWRQSREKPSSCWWYRARRSARLGRVDRRHELRSQITHQIVDLSRRHHRAQRTLFGQRHAVARRVEAQLAVGHAGLRSLGHELPEARAAGGVRDQVDARVWRGVLDAVQAPVVEQPGLAAAHVHGLAAAVKQHFGPRDDGDVHAHAIEPVVVDVGVLGHHGAGIEAQQARAAPHRAEARENLAHVR